MRQPFPLWPQTSQKRGFKAEYGLSYANLRAVSFLICLLPALAGVTDHYSLVRILVTGSTRLAKTNWCAPPGFIVNTHGQRALSGKNRVIAAAAG
jgi:hypothetical protein